jgi:hypothetical protein
VFELGKVDIQKRSGAHSIPLIEMVIYIRLMVLDL